MVSEAAIGPWCTECGSPGVPFGPSMDPTRPLGRCKRGCSKVGGRSRVILTSDPAERLDAQRRHHRRAVTAQHRRHLDRETASPYCDHCNHLGWAYRPIH